MPPSLIPSSRAALAGPAQGLSQALQSAQSTLCDLGVTFHEVDDGENEIGLASGISTAYAKGVGEDQSPYTSSSHMPSSMQQRDGRSSAAHQQTDGNPYEYLAGSMMLEAQFMDELRTRTFGSALSIITDSLLFPSTRAAEARGLAQKTAPPSLKHLGTDSSLLLFSVERLIASEYLRLTSDLSRTARDRCLHKLGVPIWRMHPAMGILFHWLGSGAPTIPPPAVSNFNSLPSVNGLPVVSLSCQVDLNATHHPQNNGSGQAAPSYEELRKQKLETFSQVCRRLSGGLYHCENHFLVNLFESLAAAANMNPSVQQQQREARQADSIEKQLRATGKMGKERQKEKEKLEKADEKRCAGCKSSIWFFTTTQQCQNCRGLFCSKCISDDRPRVIMSKGVVDPTAKVCFLCSNDLSQWDNDYSECRRRRNSDSLGELVTYQQSQQLQNQQKAISGGSGPGSQVALLSSGGRSGHSLGSNNAANAAQLPKVLRRVAQSVFVSSAYIKEAGRITTQASPKLFKLGSEVNKRLRCVTLPPTVTGSQASHTNHPRRYSQSQLQHKATSELVGGRGQERDDFQFALEQVPVENIRMLHMCDSDLNALPPLASLKTYWALGNASLSTENRENAIDISGDNMSDVWSLWNDPFNQELPPSPSSSIAESVAATSGSPSSPSQRTMATLELLLPSPVATILTIDLVVSAVSNDEVLLQSFNPRHWKEGGVVPSVQGPPSNVVSLPSIDIKVIGGANRSELDHFEVEHAVCLWDCRESGTCVSASHRSYLLRRVRFVINHNNSSKDNCPPTPLLNIQFSGPSAILSNLKVHGIDVRYAFRKVSSTAVDLTSLTTHPKEGSLRVPALSVAADQQAISSPPSHLHQAPSFDAISPCHVMARQAAESVSLNSRFVSPVVEGNQLLLGSAAKSNNTAALASSSSSAVSYDQLTSKMPTGFWLVPTKETHVEHTTMVSATSGLVSPPLPLHMINDETLLKGQRTASSKIAAIAFPIPLSIGLGQLGSELAIEPHHSPYPSPVLPRRDGRNQPVTPFSLVTAGTHAQSYNLNQIHVARACHVRLGTTDQHVYHLDISSHGGKGSSAEAAATSNVGGDQSSSPTPTTTGGQGGGTSSSKTISGVTVCGFTIDCNHPAISAASAYRSDVTTTTVIDVNAQTVSISTSRVLVESLLLRIPVAKIVRLMGVNARGQLDNLGVFHLPYSLLSTADSSLALSKKGSALAGQSPNPTGPIPKTPVYFALPSSAHNLVSIQIEVLEATPCLYSPTAVPPGTILPPPPPPYIGAIQLWGTDDVNFRRSVASCDYFSIFSSAKQGENVASHRPSERAVY
eukprot:GILI01020637.1.p1 GENE.GILI01020637.1~~GILI01020637.1.p1  ORF type:complete len:1346 (+),score=181.45 GILI01020637.1:54-4040(+)